jgi:beta-lactamase regulating signal transducer with metallopeptidase domain
MKLAHFNQWLSDREINAICWTLIHSLWIGLIVAALGGLIIACTRKSTAKLRYRLFCALLVVFTLVMVGVAMYEMVENEAKLNATVSPVSATDQILAGKVLAGDGLSLIDTITTFLNHYAGWIFGLWFIFFVFKGMQLIAGVFYIQRIRKYKAKELAEDWLTKVQAFSATLGIKAKVLLIQSALVKVPVTFGYFKPVIVLPIGMVFQLPAEQVETILWHELAHIYRRDYLVNILQKVIEAVFFFNPAILWLSALIREEREASCDDIVLANVQHKTSYLAALVAFHSQKQNIGSLAMGLSLRPNQLMNRLRRMVNQENKRLSFVELFVLALGLLLLSAFTFIPQVKPSIKNGVVYIKKALTENLATTPDQASLPKPTAKSSKPLNEAIQQTNDSLGLDTLLKFKSIRFKNSNQDKANRELNVIDGQDNRYHIIVAGGLIRTVEFNEMAVPETEFKNYEKLLVQIDEIVKRKLKNPSPQYIKEHWVNNKSALGWQKTPEKKSIAGSSKAAVDQKLSAKDLFFLNKPNAEIRPSKKKLPKIDATDDKNRVLGVIASLVAYKVVANVASVNWFALTDDQLVVNDQKQSSQLHQQLKEKYGIKPKYDLFFGPSKVHGAGIIFDKTDL